jgi:thiol-disulfide isomerase/thioredoxin
MKRLNKFRILPVIFLIVASNCIQAQFNPSPTLKIGDPAPTLTVNAWVRGEQVTQFVKGEVYVVDFWATWCGGCINSFPHISAIARKYEGRVHFFSVDSYEDVDEKKGVDPVKKVTEFLKTPQGQRLTLDVGVDGTDNQMFNSWIKPLRRAGFPTTFVIDQEGRIAWVDVNLDHLDWVLGQVLAGTWDRGKAAAVMKEKDALEDLFIKAYQAEGAGKKELFDKLLASSEAFIGQFPDRKDAAAFYKLMALLELDTEKVPELLEEMAANPLSRYINLADAAGLTLMEEGLSKRHYEAVAKVQERLLLNEFPVPGRDGKSIHAYEELADTYAKAGDYPMAKESIGKAIALAMKEGASDEEVTKLKDTMNSYLKQDLIKD